MYTHLQQFHRYDHVYQRPFFKSIFKPINFYENNSLFFTQHNVGYRIQFKRLKVARTEEFNIMRYPYTNQQVRIRFRVELAIITEFYFGKLKYIGIKLVCSNPFLRVLS